MTSQRKMHLGTFLAGTGSNMASWRHPNAVNDAAINLDYYRGLTRKAEAASSTSCSLAMGCTSARSPTRISSTGSNP